MLMYISAYGWVNASKRGISTIDRRRVRGILGPAPQDKTRKVSLSGRTSQSAQIKERKRSRGGY